MLCDQSKCYPVVLFGAVSILRVLYFYEHFFGLLLINGPQPLDLLTSFSDILNTFTNIPQQTASRIPIFLFDSQVPEVMTKHKYSEQEMDKLKALVEFFSYKLSLIAGELMEHPEVQSWINDEYEGLYSNYKKQISDLIGDIYQMPKDVKEFIENQPKAFRGLKGSALKDALIEVADERGLEKISNLDDSVILEILETADEYFKAKQEITNMLREFAIYNEL